MCRRNVAPTPLRVGFTNFDASFSAKSNVLDSRRAVVAYAFSNAALRVNADHSSPSIRYVAGHIAGRRRPEPEFWNDR